MRQKVVVVAIGLSAGVAGLYICYTRYRNRRAPRRASPEKMETIERQLKIPQEALKVIVGKQGNIRQRLQKQTDAYITVSERVDSEGDYNVTITGSHAQVHQAQEALNRLLQESVVLRVGLLLPARCMSRIIGKDGDKIQSIIRSSGAKICIGPKSEDSAVQASNVTIIGTTEQVDKAKLLIQKILEEEETLQQRESKSSFRYHRKEIIAVKKGQTQTGDQAVAQIGEKLTQNGRDEAGTSGSHEDTAYSSGSSTDSASNLSKFEVPSPDFNFQVGEYVDVYVSALENPQHFWIQIQGSRLSQLDKLIEEMRDYYSNQTKTTAEIQVGDIVAAPFRNHSDWYRAEVLGFLDNGDVDLYYVDYGDNWSTAMDNLFPLRSDFLSLPFQAVECCLAGISPAGGHWPEEAVNKFEELTHGTEWKPLLANICSFPSVGMSQCFEVQLYDPSFDQILNIGQQLIRQGFAIEQKESPLQAENTLSRLLDEVINPQSLSFSSKPGEHSAASEVLKSSGREDDVILLED